MDATRKVAQQWYTQYRLWQNVVAILNCSSAESQDRESLQTQQKTANFYLTLLMISNALIK